MVHITEIAGDALSALHKNALFALWNAEYPTNILLADSDALEQYLAGMEQSLHYFAAQDGEIVAWAATFNRNGDRWFGIIVGRKAQNTGIGTRLLAMLRENNAHLYGWATDHNRYCRADGTVYPSPVAFYLKQGFVILEHRLETSQLSAVQIRWSR